MAKNNRLRTWIEIDKNALEHNLREFLKLISPKTRLMAVVKSNAYGHGLAQVANLLASYQLPVTSNRLWFGVDSIIEALRLREEGIKNAILVLGYTLPEMLKEAAARDIVVTVSTFETLREISGLKTKPKFHIKIDTGMHRQGFLPRQIQKLIKLIRTYKLIPEGIFTHFAIAKDCCYPAYTFLQAEKFENAIGLFRKSGFNNLIRHAAASGGTILYPGTHLDMVRIGMGLYGYYPSPESEINLSSGMFNLSKIDLKPVLTWKTLVGEVKEIPSGSCVGYDLTERVFRKTKIAVLPVGYWHGFDRGLSGTGEILIRGRKRKVLGRVSMDMVVVDVTESPRAAVGDEAVLIGRQGKESIWAGDLAMKIGTSPYEVLTRVNPLIERIIV